MTFCQRVFCYYGPYDGGLACSYFSYDVNEVSCVDIHVEIIDDLRISACYVGVSE